MSCTWVTDPSDYAKPPDGYTHAPYVKVKFRKSGMEITVGNHSSPQDDNDAVIVDFEIGTANGGECRVTIFDSKGGSFAAFMQDILKSFDVNDQSFSMICEYGWISTQPQNGVKQIKSSPRYAFIPQSVESNFSGGKFLFLITGNDISRVMYDGGYEKIQGADGGEIPITDAIRNMFSDPQVPPIVKADKIYFKSKRPGATEAEDLLFDPVACGDGDQKKGPKGKWIPNGSKIQTARNWLSGFKTARGKSFLIKCDVTEDANGSITIWEDFGIKDENIDMKNLPSLGPFWVNSGKKSNVLEFSPRIQWDFWVASRGGGMGENKTLLNKDGKVKDPLGLAKKGQGSLYAVTPQENHKNIFGKQASDEAAIAQATHLSARNFAYKPIEAELVLVGDPLIVNSELDPAISHFVKIIFLNPTFVTRSNNGSYDWTSKPTCNEVLTNDSWRISSVNHKISDGQYRTTLSLELAVPNIDSPCPKLGGCGAEGFVVT